jgi:hypothetical protein
MSKPVKLPCPWGKSRPCLKGVALSTAQKTWLGSELAFHNTAILNLVVRFQLPAKLMQKWAAMLRKGVTPNRSGGRPTLLGTPEQKKIVAMCTGNAVQLRSEDFDAAFNAEVKMKVEAAGKIFQKPHEKTLRTFEKKHSIKTKAAETSTDARLVATSDICNFITFAAMNYAFVVLLKIHPALIMNIDATQFTVGSDFAGKTWVKVAGEVEAKGGVIKAAPEKGDNSNGVAFFIKYYLLMSATGDVHDPVFVVQDKYMKEGAFTKFWVPGLGVGTDLRGGGWLCFCQTRGCNLAFYRWLFRDYFCETVLKVRTAYHLLDDSPAWFQLDGEPLQIKCFEEESLADHFCELCIVCGKPPASTTECTQACDCGNCFKGSKTALKGIKDVDIDVDLYAWQIEYLRDKVFAVHMAETRQQELEPPAPPPDSAPKGKKKKKLPEQMSSEHRKMAIMGLLRIQKAVGAAVKRSTVQDSWKKTGIYPFSLDTILASCKKKVSIKERDIIYAGLPKLARRIMDCGELLGADLTTALGPDIYLPHLFSRDLLVMYRRRSVILTHQAILAGLWQKVRGAVEKAAAAQQKKADAVEEKATKKRKKEAGENAVLLITRKKPLSSSSSSSSNA